MQNYIWIVLVIFVIAIVGYLKSIRLPEEENTEDARYLLGIGGIYNGQTFTIGKEIVIGRNPDKCSIIYPDETKGISSIHCKIMVENGKVSLIDLASTYGTFRDNGEKLVPQVVYAMEVGDGFYIGNVENTFLIK